jgi:dTDP-4-dehydrorhamnose reductase
VLNQIGTPIYAKDLAGAILKIISDTKTDQISGIFRCLKEGVIGWYEFTKAIFDIKGRACKETPLRTIEYPTPAERSAY